MIYRTLEQIKVSPYNVDCGNGRSRRFLVEKDKMGFTLTDTLIDAGSATELKYDHHLEACYCISGTGEVGGGNVVAGADCTRRPAQSIDAPRIDKPANHSQPQ